MNKGFFITGTDTNVGKTFVACCLLKTLQENQNLAVHPRKPIASGAIRFTSKKLISEDAMLLKKASLTDESLNIICPYLFEEPVSPARAIKINNATINLTDLVKACDTPKNSIAVIEGAGGFYSPLVEKQLNSDLAEKLQLPVIIVTENKLGCINQTMLSIEAVKKSQLEIACIIINDTSLDADQENVTDLKEIIHLPCIHLSYKPTNSPVSLGELYKILRRYLA